jgi:hypothetical protein
MGHMKAFFDKNNMKSHPTEKMKNLQIVAT